MITARFAASTFLTGLLVVLAAPGAPAAPAPAPAVKKPSPYPSAMSNATAPVELIEDLDGAKINWSTGRLSVSGVGTPGDRGPMAFRRQLSARAALADAYRRLAGSLEVVRVDANARFKDLAVADDALRSRLNDFVKSAKVLETNYWPDGSAEVVLGTDLRGSRSLASLIAGNATVPAPSPTPTGAASPTPAPATSPSPTASGSPDKEIVTEPVPLRASYSSVVIDARGLGAQPALLPNVRDDGGKVVDLEPGDSRANVRYLRDGAELDPSAGVNPLRLKALRTQGPLKADCVLTPEASATLKAALLDKKLAPGSAVIILL